MGYQSAGFGRLYSWDRSSAGGLVVLFAGVGFFCGTVGAMATEIGIPFAGVQVLCGGASGGASEVWVLRESWIRGSPDSRTISFGRTVRL